MLFCVANVDGGRSSFQLMISELFHIKLRRASHRNINSSRNSLFVDRVETSTTTTSTCRSTWCDSTHNYKYIYKCVTINTFIPLLAFTELPRSLLYPQWNSFWKWTLNMGLFSNSWQPTALIHSSVDLFAPPFKRVYNCAKWDITWINWLQDEY
jgi:hypothetical protein